MLICQNINGIFYSLVLTTTTIIFFSLNFNDHPIKRPPITDALKIITKTLKYYIQDNDVFKNYVKTKKIFQDNKMVLLENHEQQNDDISIWFLCLNNARFAVGDKKLEDDLKCKNFKLNDTDFIFISTHKLPDFLLKNYKKKN